MANPGVADCGSRMVIRCMLACKMPDAAACGQSGGLRLGWSIRWAERLPPDSPGDNILPPDNAKMVQSGSLPYHAQPGGGSAFEPIEHLW